MSENDVASPHADQERALAMHKAYVDELNKRSLSNSENFDKSILTYSASGLALSLAFLKDYVHITTTSPLWELYGSWICFGAAIVLTVGSYPVGQWGLEKQETLADDYYLRGNVAAFNGQNLGLELIRWMSLAAGAFFIAAIILTAFFVASGVTLTKGISMAENKPQYIICQDSASVPKMQAVDVTKAAGIPKMTAVPVQVQPAQSVSAPAASSSTAASTQPKARS